MESWGEWGLVNAQIDAWQEELVAWEAEIARIRARQVELIRRLDRFQVDTAQGARTMGDWASVQLDVSRQTATRLTQLAHSSDPVSSFLHHSASPKPADRPAVRRALVTPRTRLTSVASLMI